MYHGLCRFVTAVTLYDGKMSFMNSLGKLHKVPDTLQQIRRMCGADQESSVHAVFVQNVVLVTPESFPDEARFRSGYCRTILPGDLFKSINNWIQKKPLDKPKAEQEEPACVEAEAAEVSEDANVTNVTAVPVPMPVPFSSAEQGSPAAKRVCLGLEASLATVRICLFWLLPSLSLCFGFVTLFATNEFSYTMRTATQCVPVPAEGGVAETPEALKTDPWTSAF